MSLPEKIKEIEEEMKKTQYHKHTEHHFGLLKAKLAKLRADLEKSTSKGGSPAFEVKKGVTKFGLDRTAERWRVRDSQPVHEC